MDVLACPDCGGRLRLLATIADRAVVETILTHLGLPADPPRPSAARTPAWLPGVRAAADHLRAGSVTRGVRRAHLAQIRTASDSCRG
jgi:hypothetical protein